LHSQKMGHVPNLMGAEPAAGLMGSEAGAELAVVCPMNELGGGALITGALIANNCLFEEMPSLGGGGGFELSGNGARAGFAGNGGAFAVGGEAGAEPT
jgi:hypothetical protein